LSVEEGLDGFQDKAIGFLKMSDELQEACKMNWMVSLDVS